MPLEIVIILLSYLLIYDAHSRDHSVSTFFKRTDENGNLINRASPDYDKDIPKQFSSFELSNDGSNPVLKVSPSIVENSGTVFVSWYGVTNPQEKDFIAFYCPINDNPSHYLDFVFVSTDINWPKGYGSFSAVVYNLRTSCQFRYYRNNAVTAQAVAISNSITFANDAPLQGHIALTGHPSEMRIQWTSGVSKEAVVRYGLTLKLDQVSTTVNVSTYHSTSMCESPANSTGFWDPGYLYDALLQSLKPNTLYYYSYGTKMYMSQIFNFTTPIPAGDTTSYKFVTYGDMGISPFPRAIGTDMNLLNRLQRKENIRFVLHHGDISYSEGHAYVWDQFMSLIEPCATLMPYLVGIGNHEQDHVSGGIEHDPSGAPGDGGFRPKWGNNGHDSGGECGVPVFKRFHMPDNGNAVWWYSFDYGLAHYTIMSTEHDFTPGSRQYLWLENDLRNVNRSKTPWLVFTGHRAMYCSEMYPLDYVVGINMRRLFEDLLYKYKVDLALWSHYHTYERTCKVYLNECCEDGITHIVVGSSGKNIDKNIWLPKTWARFHSNSYGFGMVTIVNSSSLHWEWIENNSNEVKDDVWLHK